MKTFSVFMCVFSLTYFSQAGTIKPSGNSDSSSVGKNVISTDLFGIATLLFSSSLYKADISFEHAISHSFSGTLTLEAGNYAEYEISGGSGYEDMSFEGYGITPEVRFYPFHKKKRKAPLGFSLSLYYKYLRLNQKYSGKESSTQSYPPFKQPGNVMGPGIAAGYKFGRNKLHLELVYGYTFMKSSGFIFDERSGGFKDDSFDTFGLRFEVRLGYQF